MRPILFTAFGYQIVSAPVFSGLAALAAYLYFERGKKKLPLSEDDFWGVIAALAFGVFAGAVGFYALAYGPGLRGNLLFLLRHRDAAGGSFLGTYLGAAGAAFLYCRFRRLPYAPVGDTLGAAAPLGLCVMRLGCFLNGCCYGRPTTLPWGVIFRQGVPLALRGVPLHPTQLYESAGSLLIFLLVDRGVRPRIASGALRPGDALAASVALYALLRFGVDFLRAGDPGVLAPLGLSLAQWAGLATMAGVAARWALAERPAA